MIRALSRRHWKRCTYYPAVMFPTQVDLGQEISERQGVVISALSRAMVDGATKPTKNHKYSEHCQRAYPDFKDIDTRTDTPSLCNRYDRRNANANANTMVMITYNSQSSTDRPLSRRQRKAPHTYYCTGYNSSNAFFRSLI